MAIFVILFIALYYYYWGALAIKAKFTCFRHDGKLNIIIRSIPMIIYLAQPLPLKINILNPYRIRRAAKSISLPSFDDLWLRSVWARNRVRYGY